MFARQFAYSANIKTQIKMSIKTFPYIFVRFKGESLLGDLSIHYKVHEMNVMAYDPILEKECLCHKIDALDYVSVDYLEIVNLSPDAVSAFEIVDELKFKNP